VRPAGAVLEAVEIAGFIPLLDMSREISTQVSGAEKCKALGRLTLDLTGQPDLLRTIVKSVDHEGNIRDNASSALASIRKERRKLEAGIQKRLEEMTREPSVSVFLQDDFITKRAGRWVIPVRMDSKGQVAGVVHDISKSGETAFIEPLAIIHLSNELENLAAEEKAEELRILRAISAMIREKADGVAAEFAIIVHLDMLNCIAQFAEHLHMEVPEIREVGMIRLVRARHPLLMLSYLKTEGEERVVPLDLHLGTDDTIMVITGSNAGGKTIAIKTVGLLLCMALSGMPVPASSASVFPMVELLLVDMGDEQSIENNLSTFSAHVRNIAKILGTADERALVLIDELGTGTDPDEGTALACAVLKELKTKGCFVLATTHLVGIKGFVHRTAGMLNASMEFDKTTLTPLYRLRTGEPGQSHALEIAQKYGLPEQVICSAREMLGGNKVELDALMADLNQKRAEYERLLREMALREEDIRSREQATEKKIAEAAAKQKEILAGAYKESREVIADTRRQMRDELESLGKIEKKELQERLREVEQKQKAVSEKLAEYEHDDSPPLRVGDISVGDKVFVKSLGYDGTVSGIMEKVNRIKVISGSKEVLVPVADVRLKKGREVAERENKHLPLSAPDEMVPSRISLVGTRVDEALSRLEPFLNHAALAGFREAVIIHGVGTGALKRAVREHLTGHPLVKAFRSGDQSEGGAGVTIVILK
jgi:DNA mismatch repair protein MutS2